MTETLNEHITEHIIEVKSLARKYGDFTAVDHLSFSIEKGKIYGLLGRNGAGKSTTMNILAGCLAPTEGSVIIAGHDITKEPEAAKRHIGYLPENPPLYPDMTPYEYLVFVAEAKGVSEEKSIRQVEQAMKLTGLLSVQDRLIRNLSKGYRQRVGIAQAMLGNPDVIILDEPTVGLDPKQIIEIRDLIRRLGEIKTVILSSHILQEIQAVCDHLMIISGSKLVADDTLTGLEESMNRDVAIDLVIKGDYTETVSTLQHIHGIESFVPIRGKVPGTVEARVLSTPGGDPREAIFFAFAEKKFPILQMNRQILTLEDIFLRLTEDSYSAVKEEKNAKRKGE